MKEILIRLIDYEFYGNKKIIQSLQTAVYPSERAIELMSHILSAEEVWLNRMQENILQIQVWQKIPLNDLLPVLEKNNHSIKKFLVSIQDENLLKNITYLTSKGEQFTNTIQDIILHLSHHSAYHRGQIAQLIRSASEKPPVTDYIVWVREEPSGNI